MLKALLIAPVLIVAVMFFSFFDKSRQQAAELDALKARNQQLLAEVEMLRAQDLRAENTRLLVQILEERRQKEQLQQTIAALQTEHDRLSGINSVFEQEYLRLQGQLQALQVDYQQLETEHEQALVFLKYSPYSLWQNFSAQGTPFKIILSLFLFTSLPTLGYGTYHFIRFSTSSKKTRRTAPKQ